MLFDGLVDYVVAPKMAKKRWETLSVSHLFWLSSLNQIHLDGDFVCVILPEDLPDETSHRP